METGGSQGTSEDGDSRLEAGIGGQGSLGTLSEQGCTWEMDYTSLKKLGMMFIGKR